MEPLNTLENNGKVFPVSLRPENTVFSPIAERGDVIMNVSPLAGKPTEPSMLANIPRLVTAYYTGRPDPFVPEQRVAFGTLGHRGSSLKNLFNEATYSGS